ncbi:16S rRNA (guanine(527)-N(7))-methyltransferase RsmG [Roseovarius sp. SYSU LYC5161]|uniref:16S rRNA (guanine(527)-N(7))-methyltransferase RsmG n=1 Tax=Roseovarius halophilus (ex Wu et al. 2025) TaxID=3376060 RepID=UPI002871778A|nr:16S rRNA (guanine(527)-N(7))-methyltransferase RsmG [Roseovarius sp.]
MTVSSLADVSRETSERLSVFSQLLRKWNARINLVSQRSMSDLWNRHFVDSLQIFDLAPKNARHWVDIGSGGGFPGLVVAILAAELSPDLRITLVESDVRKCAFLRAAAREAGVSVDILNERIEAIPRQKADILSARALSDLAKLLAFTENHLAPTGTGLFPKGRTWKNELENARSTWKFAYQVATSRTDENSVILSVQGVERD